MAVHLRGVSKLYNAASSGNSASGLKDIDLHVHVGQVYTILGPSGCGKTTLLHCILGRLTVDTGRVLVFGRTPGTSGSEIPGQNVGYMPQELSLFMDLTIGETLRFFGRLLQMSANDIELRIRILAELLHLPVETRLVKNLSGGQQRNLSFCCSLIHEPKLLVLDEPTVGVDPILRKSIWEHCSHIAKTTNCTIIITTHCIEETINADMIAFMRQGRILAESSPQCLLQSNKMPTLESAFLRLCRMDDAIQQKNEEQKIVSAESKESKWNESSDITDCYKFHKFNSKLWPNAARLTALLIKQLIIFRRHPSFLLFLVIFPVIELVFCSLVLSENYTNLRINYVNDDIGSFGELYLKHMRTDSIELIKHSNINAAEDSVLIGQAWGTIFIGRNYTESITQRFKNGIFVDDATINQSEIIIRLDMTNLQISYNLTSEIQRAYQTFSADVLTKLGLDSRIGQGSIAFAGNIYGSTHVSFNDYYAPAVIISMTFFLSCALTGISFMVDHKDDLFVRSWVAGLTEVENALSHIVLQLLLMSTQLSLVFLDIFCFSSLSCKGPVSIFILLIFLQGLCGMSFGLLVAAISKDFIVAILIFFGALYSQGLLAGIIWPLEGMSIWLRYISYALPQTYATEALRFIMSRGWSMQYETVWLSFIITIAWTVVHIILSIIALRLRCKLHWKINL